MEEGLVAERGSPHADCLHEELQQVGGCASCGFCSFHGRTTAYVPPSRSDWSVDDRCTLLRLLCALSAESVALHDTLHGDEEEVGDGQQLVGALHEGSSY